MNIQVLNIEGKSYFRPLDFKGLKWCESNEDRTMPFFGIGPTAEPVFLFQDVQRLIGEARAAGLVVSEDVS